MTFGRLCRVIGIVWLALVLTAPLAPTAWAVGRDSHAGGASQGLSCVYVVQRGDTMLSIARRYRVDVWALARANGIYNLNRIYVGQRLVIPGCYMPPVPSGCSQHAPFQYVVLRGDTLTSIASRYGTTVSALMQCNGINNPNLIYAGQVLVICTCPPVPSWPPQPCPGYWCPPPPSLPPPSQPPVPPPPPPPPPPPAHGPWTGQYFNNRDLAGMPVLERPEASLDYNWGWGSPAPPVPPDNFSARWTGNFYMVTGTYRVTARTDDGVRVYVDGIKVIDSWQIQAVTEYQQDIVVYSGYHTFVVEYFEAEGLAEVRVSWRRIG